MKKILAFVLVFILSLSMVACQNNDTPGDTSSTQSASGENTSETSKPNNDVDISGTITEETVRKYKAASESDFEYEDEKEGIKITKYVGNDTIVVIPEKIAGKPVVALKTYLFANESPVKGVFVPNSVKKLKYTFINNDDIQVVICEGVEELSDAVAMNCASLHTLVLGDELSEMGEYSIAVCPKLTEVYISSKVTNIAQNYDSYDVFSDCPIITIKGEKGSYIETYTKDNGLKFEAK